MGIKENLYFLGRRLGGHRLPRSIKQPVGNFFISYKGTSEKAPFFKKRVEFVTSLVEKTIHLDGPLIECGVFRGVTTMSIEKKLKELGSNKIVYGIDVFDSFPYDDNDFPFEQKKIFKKKFTKNKGALIPTIDEIQKKLDEQNLDNVKLIKGLVENVLPLLNEKQFCFASVDVDSYKATKFCVQFFKERISKDGIIFLDDYNEPGWPGATQSANEILGKSSIIALPHVQAYWINQWFSMSENNEFSINESALSELLKEKQKYYLESKSWE